MRLDGWLVLVMVRLGMAAAAPRTPDGALPEAVQRTLTGMEEVPYQLDSGHKLHRPHHSHRVRHRSRGTLAPEAEIRCYCSLPACLTTGYMCQSMVGSCFSETVQAGRRVHMRHGCLELLPRHKQRICERLHSENKADQRLRCCTEDMCNIAGDAAVALELDRRTARVKNSSLAAVPTPPAQLFSVAGGRAQPAGQLWLRAATIAVPIAGLFILAFLVLLAVRMLRRETKPQYQYAKAPLCLEPAPTRPSGAAGAAVAERVGAAGAAVTGRVGAAPCHPGAPVHCVWRSDT